MRPCLLFFGLIACANTMANPPIEQLQLPRGFRISVFSDQVPSARELTVGAHGTVFAGSMRAGVVYALTDADHDGHAERVRVIARDLQLPVGVAFHNGDLYISAVSRILALRDIEQHLDDPPAPQIINDKLPTKTHHGWKFIAFGPDEKLYVPVGAPCNICDPGADFAKLLRMDADGSHWRDIAFGIRNSVGFDWQPGSGKLWFTDNGRDLLGDDLPSDELNRTDHAGEHFGYPYCHQGDTPDPQFGKDHSCSNYAAPALKLGAHVAALGMRFYTGKMFPAPYRGAILIAEHGSWNRSKKSGYRVMLVRVRANKVIAQTPFITGFLQDEKAWGRPVDVQALPDGSVLISDDMAGAVYRVTYCAQANSKTQPDHKNSAQ